MKLITVWVEVAEKGGSLKLFKKKEGNSSFASTFLGDVFGGVTSAIVMLPMALAFGVASGPGSVARIYGVAVFGGTPSQISGPIGPMTIAMAAVV